MKLALVTYYDEGKYAGEGSSEDQRLEQYLNQKGLQVTFEYWTNPQVKWEEYDLVIIKSTWDYFDRIHQFLSWLDILEKKQVRVLNPIPVIRWNTNKQYLLEVEKAGFAIVPTQIIYQGEQVHLPDYYEEWQTQTLIIKPLISGGAKNTFAVSKSEIATFYPTFEELLVEEPYLVQPFMPEVQTQGEWSLLFYNGKFSHCVLKVPQTGEFRVQHYFGGAIIPTTPPASILETAQQLVNTFAQGCLYARVDGLNSNGIFTLMELELIEPLLYMLDQEKLYENYYQAVLALAK
ncbi:ATP-grasp domain-containing protein [Adhaeribacter aquaticus]|uniref:ATP-grasp domain-containing protein n=1 Tax=Adhaeribacter aquaticus TaxID=299567 RepID=UPI0004010C94|nr:hypothetical protein [Adhaeribacter aquaticus]